MLNNYKKTHYSVTSSRHLLVKHLMRKTLSLRAQMKLNKRNTIFLLRIPVTGQMIR